MALLPTFLRRAAFTLRSGSYGGLPSAPAAAAPKAAAIPSARALSKRPEGILALQRCYATRAESEAASSLAQRSASDTATAAASGTGIGSTSTDSSSEAPTNFLALADHFKRPKARQRSMTPVEFENAFRERQRRGWSAPQTPESGRSASVSSAAGGAAAALRGGATGGNLAGIMSAYRQINVIMRKNNVRRELRLGERFEKPNQMRRRKESERHRRRFADMVRKKVQLVMQKRRRGE